MKLENLLNLCTLSGKYEMTMYLALRSVVRILTTSCSSTYLRTDEIKHFKQIKEWHTLCSKAVRRHWLLSTFLKLQFSTKYVLWNSYPMKRTIDTLKRQTVKQKTDGKTLFKIPSGFPLRHLIILLYSVVGRLSKTFGFISYLILNSVALLFLLYIKLFVYQELRKTFSTDLYNLNLTIIIEKKI